MYLNGQQLPFIFSSIGGGGSANIHKFTYYEDEIPEAQKALQIARFEQLMKSSEDFAINVIHNSTTYPANYTITDSTITVSFVSELGDGIYFIHCAPDVKELVHGFNKWDALPEVTTSDAGKFLRVDSDGKWAAVAVETAEESSF